MFLAVSWSTAGLAQRSTGGFAGAEAGVAQFGTAKLNSISGTVRIGHTLDRRGMLRIAAVASAAGIEVAVLGLGVGLELRPLSPRRITPLIGVGAGMFRDIDYPASNHGYYAVNAGVAVRIAGPVKSTLRAQYADSWKSSGFYTVHLGLEVGR